MSVLDENQWRQLHTSFRNFCQAKPWEWLDDTDLLAIEHPSGAYMGYCVALGGGGLEYGLAVYIGDEGLAHCLELIMGEAGPETLDWSYRMRALTKRKLRN